MHSATETQTFPSLDDVTDVVSDYAIYCSSYCSIVRYCSSGMCGMYCARSRDRCHALLRNAAISRLGDHSLASQKFKVLRSRWKSVRVCFRVRPTRWWCLFCAKMTSSRCHAHLLTCYVKNKGAPIALKICTSIVSTSADVVAVLVFRNSDVITLPRPFAHMLHENSKCSDCAETRHRRSWDLSWVRNDKTFSKFKRLVERKSCVCWLKLP